MIQIWSAFGADRPHTVPDRIDDWDAPVSRVHKERAVTFLIGRLTSGPIDSIAFPSARLSFENATFVGAALSQEVWRNNYIALELEAGLAHMSGSGNNTPQIWSAGYLRYHALPWNNIIRTTIAASLGASYSFKDTMLENNRSSTGKSKKLLHYFSPETTSVVLYPCTNNITFRSPVARVSNSA